MSWGYREIINGFRVHEVHDNIDFLFSHSLLEPFDGFVVEIFVSALFFLSLSLMTQTDDMIQNFWIAK